MALVGRERVLFASDFPILRQDRLLRKVARALAARGIAGVLGGNAARVYIAGDISGEGNA